MQVTLDIDGRKAIPIRAIPRVTNWKESPDSIVRALAAPKIIRKCGFEIPSRQNNLFAYQMDTQGHFEQVLPEQWESLVVILDSLTKKLQADEREDADGENWAPWRIKAVLELPDNVFVWLDEFQRWYSINRPLVASDDYLSADLKWKSNHESLLAKLHDPNSELSESEWAMLDVPPPELEQENDRLCLTPIFPPEINNRLWRYAEDFIATAPDWLQKLVTARHQHPIAVVEPVVIHHLHYPHQVPAMEAPPAEQVGPKAIAATKVEAVPVKTPGDDKPWLIANPSDPKPEQPWYIPARYFARQLVKEDSTLLGKRNILANNVVKLLTDVGIKKRGGREPFDPGTILKALSKVSLG